MEDLERGTTTADRGESGSFAHVPESDSHASSMVPRCAGYDPRREPSVSTTTRMSMTRFRRVYICCDSAAGETCWAPPGTFRVFSHREESERLFVLRLQDEGWLISEARGDLCPDCRSHVSDASRRSPDS